MIKDFIDDTKIENILDKAKNPALERVREIIAKAGETKRSHSGRSCHIGCRRKMMNSSP